MTGYHRSWSPLGDPPPDTLPDARLQLHHLVQILAAFGATFVQPREDDSHRALTWSSHLGGFRSRSWEGGDDGPEDDVFMVVSPLPLEVRIHAGDDVHRYVLPGHTLGEAWDWAERELALILGRETVHLERPEYEIPDHGVARQAPFDASPLALEELGRWYHDAELILEEVRNRNGADASPVLAWPHHFDLATLITVAREDGDPVRTVGVGMSPGDEGNHVPYLYVRPWPDPDPSGLPALPAGYWNTEGWVGAVLPADEITSVSAAAEQSARVQGFVDAAEAASRSLLEGLDTAM